VRRHEGEVHHHHRAVHRHGSSNVKTQPRSNR
jgi:hypothetical protein